MCEFKTQRSSQSQATTQAECDVENTISHNKQDNPVLSASKAYFEQAVEATKFGKFNYCVILLSGLVLSNVLLETLGISFVLPVSKCDLQLNVQQSGVISAVGFAGIIFSSHLWGFLADTTGRRNVIRPTLLVGFCITVMSSFSKDFWTLCILRFANGICVSGGSATIYAFLGEFHSNKNRARAIMISAFVFSLGSMMMPAIAWLVINQDWRFTVPLLDITYKPWRLFLVVCGLPGFICGLCLFMLPESPKYLLMRGDEKKALKILQSMFKFNTGRPVGEYPFSHVCEDPELAIQPKNNGDQSSNGVIILLRSMWKQTQPLFNTEYRLVTILICSVQFWIFVTSNGVYMWFPSILNGVVQFMSEYPGNRTHICDVVYRMHQTHPMVPRNESTALTEECSEKLEISTYGHAIILEAMYSIGFAFIGLIINRVGKKFILFGCLVICGACGIASIYVDEPLTAIYLLLVLLACGVAINVLSAVAVDLYPTQLRAMAVCISLMMGRLGSVVGANIMGALLTNHCEMAFMVSGTSLIMAAFLALFISRPKREGQQLFSRTSSMMSTARLGHDLNNQ